MSIFDELRSALRSKYDGGMTQQEIADKSGISRSHICKLLNGSRCFSEVTLGNVFKLFPDAVLSLKQTSAADDLDEKILELVQGLSQKAKLDLIVELSRMTANKSAEVAAEAGEKVG